RHVAERVLVSLVVPARHARVPVPEQLEVSDPEHVACSPQLRDPRLDEGFVVVPVLTGLDPAGHVAELAVRARDEDRPDPFVGTSREHAAGAVAFVVRVRVHGHERQHAHDRSLPERCYARRTEYGTISGAGCAGYPSASNATTNPSSASTVNGQGSRV